MRITYRPAGFKTSDPALQTGERSLTFTRAELVHAVVTLGRANVTDVLQFGDLSLVELVWRTAMLLANVQQRADGSLEWSPACRGLDPSERVAVSYFTGMTFAKLMSGRLLDVPWLLHLDVYRSLLSPTFQAGDQRPDLVGQNVAGQWVALEAKGGAGNLKATGWARAQAQLANLRTVQGVPVQQRVTAVTFQRRRAKWPCLHVEFRDPPAGERGFDLDVSPQQLRFDYYSRIRQFMGEELSVLPEVVSASGSRVVGRYVPEVDFFLGLAEEIVRSPAADASAPAYAEIAAAVRRKARGPADSEWTAVGIDGVAVALGPSWERRFAPET